MYKVKFKVDPDGIIISYFIIGLMLSSLLMGLQIYIKIPLNLLRSIVILYHGGFWIYFGWYASNYFKRN